MTDQHPGEGARCLPVPFRRIGVIGLGIMGSAIAEHLIDAGYEVVGYDIDENRLVDLARLGGTTTESVGTLVERAELVITSLPSEESFRHVMAQIGRAAAAGLVVADTSTLASDVKRGVADFLAERSVTLLDCPLSGTGAQARSGDLVALMSGPAEEMEAASTVFSSFCRKRSLVGGFGQGSDLKLVANLLVAVHTLAAAEALILAEKVGLDTDVVIAALSDSAAGSRMLEVRGPAIANGGWRQPNMRLDLFMKDLRLIRDLAGRAQSPTPLFGIADDYYHAAQLLGLGEYDTASVVEALREPDALSGSDLGAPGSRGPDPSG